MANNDPKYIMSEFERTRMKNIEERKKLWDELMDAKAEFDCGESKNKPKKGKVKRSPATFPLRRSERSMFVTILCH